MTSISVHGDRILVVFAEENHRSRIEPGDYWFFEDRCGNSVEPRADMSGIQCHYQPCGDSGIASDTFASGVALVGRRVLNFAGELTWSLRPAVIDAITNADAAAFQAVSVAASPSHRIPGKSSTWGGIKAAYER